MAASVGDLKGYDQEFLEPPPDDLLCLICLCVARDPQQISCCGKVFCKICLEEHKEHSSDCPQCRKHIVSFPDKRSKRSPDRREHDIIFCILNTIGERDILSLKVQCDNTSNGCKWVGELRSLDEHLASCDLTLLPCPNKCLKGNNVVQLLRKDMERHMKEECPRRQYKCPHCQEEGEYQERTTKHLNECPMKEVPCPKRRCKIRIPRCDLSKHHEECQFVKVPCKYSTIGCKEEVLRKDLREHEGDSQHHFQLAVDSTHQQQITIRKQQVTISKQERKLVQLQVREAPMKYKYTLYDHHKAASEKIYSPAFYTSRGGYKMRISVNANGSGAGTGTHVSVYAHLMKGENDNHLPWPFTGTVTIELLNQMEDKNHYSRNFQFIPDSDTSQLVVNEEMNIGYGFSRYISHTNLEYDATRNCQYLKDNCLYFNISVDSQSSLKPWLV